MPILEYSTKKRLFKTIIKKINKYFISNFEYIILMSLYNRRQFRKIRHIRGFFIDYYFPNYKKCENLANIIRSFYHDISFKIVLKDPSEWDLYIDEICRIYGFKIKSNPIIFTIDGKLIGDRTVNNIYL